VDFFGPIVGDAIPFTGEECDILGLMGILCARLQLHQMNMRTELMEMSNLISLDTGM
jgi:hypothetical protein